MTQIEQRLRHRIETFVNERDIAGINVDEYVRSLSQIIKGDNRLDELEFLRDELDCAAQAWRIDQILTRMLVD